jgi:hypothetical protein
MIGEDARMKREIKAYCKNITDDEMKRNFKGEKVDTTTG